MLRLVSSYKINVVTNIDMVVIGYDSYDLAWL